MQAPHTLVFFPLHAVNIGGIEGPRCGCGSACRDIGCHPSARYRAITESVPSPSGRYGLRTGNGLVVIDVDRKNGKDGLPAWEALARKGGIPNTRVIQTPSGGLHFYFASPEPVANSQSKLAEGVDVRGEGGFVVAEGTTGRDGVTPYVCVNDVPVAPMPQWLIDLCGKRKNGRDREAIKAKQLSEAETKRRVGLFQVDCLNYPKAVQGQGGQKALWSICLRGARHYALDFATVLATVRDGFNPRCEPAWSVEELEHNIANAMSADVPLDTCEPEGFLSSLSKAWAALSGRVELLPETARRVKDPNHVYTFSPELLDYPTRARPVALLEATSILSRSPLWCGVFQYDEFLRRACAVNPPCRLDGEGDGLSRSDVSAIVCWFGSQGLSIKQELCKDAIELAAKALPYDSALDWWNTIPTAMGLGEADYLLGQLASRGFGASPTDLGSALFVKRHLIGSARRIVEGGYQHDHCLVLSGAKGLRKTTALRALYPSQFFRAQMPGLSDRDGSHALEGFLGVLFDEMGYVFRHDRETLKSYITRQEDVYRQFGNGDRVRALRRCVFFGTTNADEDLIQDTELDRRWLVVPVTGRADPEWITENRIRIWTAVKVLARGERSYLSDEEIDSYLAASQSEHTASDPWDPKIGAWLATRYPSGRSDIPSREFVGAVFEGVFGGFEPLRALRDFKVTEKRRIRDCLKRLGWQSKPVWDGASSERRYVRTRA